MDKLVKELTSGGLKPTEIAAALDIDVSKLPLRNVKGIAMTAGENKIIFIDNCLTEIEQQLVCGHELGHFLLHDEFDFRFIHEETLFYQKHEYQANLFGCQLMLGEKSEHYEAEIKQAAHCNNLREMAEIIAGLLEV